MDKQIKKKTLSREFYLKHRQGRPHSLKTNKAFSLATGSLEIARLRVEVRRSLGVAAQHDYQGRPLVLVRLQQSLPLGGNCIKHGDVSQCEINHFGIKLCFNGRIVKWAVITAALWGDYRLHNCRHVPAGDPKKSSGN